MTDPIYGIGPRASGKEPRPPQGGSGVRLPEREGDAPDGVNGIRARRRGLLIAIEGIDGCGKSSVAEAIAAALGVEVISFPNDAALTGPMIRAYLRREWRVTSGEYRDAASDRPELGALAFQALQIANRMELMPRILDELADGRDVVLCRYWQSAWVYGQLDGLPEEWLEQVHAAMVQPDVNILLDVTPEEGMRRRAARDGVKPPERYEGDLARTRKIAELYRDLWDPRFWERSTTKQRGQWSVIDASGSIEGIVLCTRASIFENRRA